MKNEEINFLEKKAREVRRGIIEQVYKAQSGHPGGSLSIADILTVLYFKEMNIDANNPKNPDRDRFVLSKGHAAPVLYSALARKGFFPVEELTTLRKFGSRLQGHPSMKCLPGIDMSTGSLGQGISSAVGMALAGKIDKKSYRVYTILGDGELEEGQVWEAAMSAAHYELDNLTAFVDFNGLQIDGDIEKVMNPCPIDKKFEAFGWNVLVIDGHNFEEIIDAIEKAKACSGKPTVVVCKTVKGKGVSFMENEAGWHGTAPSKEQCEMALAEIGGDK